MKRQFWLMKFGELVTAVETYRIAWEYAKDKYSKNKKEEKRDELKATAEERKASYYDAREQLEQFVINNPVPSEEA